MTADELREEQEAVIEEHDGSVEAEATVDEPTDDGTESAEADEGGDTVGEAGEDSQDYSAIARDDLRELKAEFPELSGLEHISGLDNPLRYAALRDLGLSPREAYLATAKRQRPDGRSHLSSAMPRGAGSPSGGMTSRQLAEAREIFSDMSDAEIRSLYKKVTR